HPVARSGAARDLRDGLRRARQDLPGDLPRAVAGPHLRAQLLGAPARGAAAPSVVAPVRPRAAGGRDLPLNRGPMDRRWIPGNNFTLLENGEEFFPRVFACIANAKREVIVETFILFEDKVGLQLQAALIAAARRGAQVDITVDDWGSPDFSARFL